MGQAQENLEVRIERMQNAVSAVAELSDDDLPIFIDSMMRCAHGCMPITAFDDVRIEAESWAAFATINELRAYFTAIWNVLPDEAKINAAEWIREKAQRETAGPSGL